MKVVIAGLVPAVLIAGGVAAQDMSAAMEQVRATCQTAKDQGSFSSLTASGEVEGSIRIKLIGKAGADAEVELTEEEWTSLRQVMPEDQLADNQNYRDCVTTLMPLVLSKLP
jgi:hypothetical protein